MTLTQGYFVSVWCYGNQEDDDPPTTPDWQKWRWTHTGKLSQPINIYVKKFEVWYCNQRPSAFQNLSVSESLIPEEYHIVKNKGLRTLEFYEEWVCSLRCSIRLFLWFKLTLLLVLLSVRSQCSCGTMNRSSGSFLRCEFKQFVYRLGFGQVDFTWRFCCVCPGGPVADWKWSSWWEWWMTCWRRPEWISISRSWQRSPRYTDKQKAHWLLCASMTDTSAALHMLYAPRKIHTTPTSGFWGNLMQGPECTEGTLSGGGTGNLSVIKAVYEKLIFSWDFSFPVELAIHKIGNSAMTCLTDGGSAGARPGRAEHLQRCFPWGDSAGQRGLCWERTASCQTPVSS